MVFSLGRTEAAGWRCSKTIFKNDSGKGLFLWNTLVTNTHIFFIISKKPIKHPFFIYANLELLLLKTNAFLGESQRPVRRISNQVSSFTLETHYYFLTYVLLTFMLYYRIHGFLRTELLVRNSFQSEVLHLRTAMKTQRFANI